MINQIRQMTEKSKQQTQYFRQYSPGQLFINNKREVFVLAKDPDNNGDVLFNLFTGEYMHCSRFDLEGIHPISHNEIMW